MLVHQRVPGEGFFSVISVILAIMPSGKSSDIAILDNDALKIIYRLQWLQLTLWLFNIAVKNGPFIAGLPINTSIYQGFFMDNQMVSIAYSTSVIFHSPDRIPEDARVQGRTGNHPLLVRSTFGRGEIAYDYPRPYANDIVFA